MPIQTNLVAGTARELTTQELLQVTRGNKPPRDILPGPRPKSPGETMNSLAVPPDPY